MYMQMLMKRPVVHRMLSVDNWLCARALYRAAVAISDDERAAVSRACRHLRAAAAWQTAAVRLAAGRSSLWLLPMDRPAQRLCRCRWRSSSMKPGRQRGHAARPILQPCHHRWRQGQLHDGSGVRPLPRRGPLSRSAGKACRSRCACSSRRSRRWRRAGAEATP